MAWHSFITKRSSKNKLKEEMIRRDERLKQKWQDYDDEHRSD